MRPKFHTFEQRAGKGNGNSASSRLWVYSRKSCLLFCAIVLFVLVPRELLVKAKWENSEKVQSGKQDENGRVIKQICSFMEFLSWLILFHHCICWCLLSLLASLLCRATTAGRQARPGRALREQAKNENGSIHARGTRCVLCVLVFHLFPHISCVA